MRVGKGDIAAFEVAIPVGSPVDGQRVSAIVRRPDFPRRCVFIGVEGASGEVEVPVGDTVIKGGTNLILAAHRPDLPQLLRCLTAGAVAALSEEQTDALQTLSMVSFLSGLAREDLAALAAGARIEARGRGETLFRAGEAGDRL